MEMLNFYMTHSPAEYNFRVVAFNENGPGLTTTEVDARTLSDKPTNAPQNFTLEVRSSTVGFFTYFTRGWIFI